MGRQGPIVNPLVKVQSDSLADMMALRSSMGLSPKQVSTNGANRAALETMIGALHELGRINPIDSAVIAAARALADAVDAAPDHASLWLQYQRALKSLELLNAGKGDDAFDRLLDQLRAPVGDTTDAEPKDARRRDRQNR